MRHVACPLIAGLTLTAVVGCASNNDPPKAQAPLTSITRSRAHVVAPLLTIRQADLPELKVRAHVAPAADLRLAHCFRQNQAAHVRSSSRQVKIAHSRRSSGARPTQRRPWAKARSERLLANSGYQSLQADSDVLIMPTAAAARSQVAAAKDTDLSCISHVLVADQSQGRFGVRGASVEPLSMTVKGADASVAYRTVLAYKHSPLVYYIDSITFSYGQDAFTLNTFHASKPVPPTMNERLLGLLVARGRSHSR